MLNRNVLIYLISLLSVSVARADGIRCLPSYKVPSANDLNLKLPDSVVTAKNYVVRKDPISGSEIRDYRVAGVALARQIEGIEPSIDRALSPHSSAYEKLDAALEFSEKLTEITATLLKQAESIVENDICKGHDFVAQHTGYLKLNMKLQSITQTTALANRYFHHDLVGSMSGIIGREINKEDGPNADLNRMRKLGLLRIRQYYYLIFKSMELGYVSEAPSKNEIAIKALRQRSDIAPQIQRLQQAFAASRADFLGDPEILKSVDFILSDLATGGSN